MTEGRNRKTDKVVVECEMEASTEKLWRALTEEELASEWLDARPARDDEYGPDRLAYRIVDAEPYRRLCYAWHDPDSPDAPPLVTIELQPMSNGNTWLRLTHGEAAVRGNHLMAANTNWPPMAQAA